MLVLDASISSGISPFSLTSSLTLYTSPLSPPWCYLTSDPQSHTTGPIRWPLKDTNTHCVQQHIACSRLLHDCPLPGDTRLVKGKSGAFLLYILLFCGWYPWDMGRILNKTGYVLRYSCYSFDIHQYFKIIE